MANVIYNNFKVELLSGTFNLSTDTVKCALMGNTAAVVAATNSVWSDVSASEVGASSGYTSGGVTLATKSVAALSTSTGQWTAASVQWTSSTITAYYAVLYDTTATSKLICGFDFGGAQSSSNGTFAIQWNSNGIINLTS
jgi:hypothetical protein